MTEGTTPAAIIGKHLETCNELHALMLEESRVMRTSGAPPSEEILRRKQALLPLLDHSLQQLRQLNESRPTFSREDAAQVDEARSKLLQILMLDRENERLLLKAALPARLKAAYQPVIPGQVARAYRKFAPTPPEADSTSSAAD